MQLHFKAKNRDGGVVEGTRESADKFSLAVELRGEGIMPFLVETVEQNPVARFFTQLNSIVQGVSLHEKIVFARNLSAMLGAGLGAARAIEILEKQTDNETLKGILRSVGGEIAAGGNLSKGLAKFPSVFPPLFVAMVHAGEESGSLPTALREVALQLEKHYGLVRKVRGALIYPGIIISAIVAIGALMLIFVVPTLTSTFKELDVDLPVTTQFIIFMSGVLTEYTLVTLLSLVVLIALLIVAARTPRGGRAFDFLLLKAPLVGMLVREVNAARTTRTLSSLLTAGVNVTESLYITKDVLQNSYYKEAVELAVERIEKGAPMAEMFKEKDELFPVMVGEMIAVGEETGKLSEMLLNVATFYEEEVENSTKDLSTVIEPVLMIIIGAAVGFFAISMVSPMYSVLNNV